MKIEPGLIRALFKVRDKAVANKDYDSFASTQVEPNLPNVYTPGYLELDELRTEVLSINPVDESSVAVKVFVKEMYRRASEHVRFAFIIYSLSKTENGWRIYAATI